MDNSLAEDSEIFAAGCKLMADLDSAIDFYNTRGVVADSEQLTSFSKQCLETATSLHNETQKQNDRISRLCYAELERHLISRSTYLLRRAKQAWPTLDEYLDACYLTKRDFNWLEDWLTSNILQVKEAYARLRKENDIDKNNIFMGSQKLRDSWEKEASYRGKLVLKTISKILGRDNLTKEITITLDFSHRTSHTGFKEGLIGLYAEQVCGINHGKSVIKPVEFLQHLGHELGHYLNFAYSKETQNRLVSGLSIFKSHSNSVIMEEIAAGFEEALFMILAGKDSDFDALEINMDQHSFTERYRDIRLSSNYFERLRAFTIFILAQKPKSNFKKVAGTFTNLSLDPNFVNIYIQDNATYWMDDGTPPPETLQRLRYHSGMFQKIFDGNKLSFGNPAWLTGLWTPVGYPEWIEINKII